MPRLSGSADRRIGAIIAVTAAVGSITTAVQLSARRR